MNSEFHACPHHHCSVRPYSIPDSEAAAIGHLRRTRPRVQPARPLGEKILVAEEDRFLRILVSNVLYRSGYTIIQAEDGEDALLKFRNVREGIDLLLLDIDMPRKNGREVYEEIRQALPDIKVMYASIYPEQVLRDRGIVEEAAHVIAKPFGPQLLLRKVREVLDG